MLDRIAMYIPKHFEQPDHKTLQAFMVAHPFVTLVTTDANGLCANHLPMLLREEPKPYGVLSGHVARANPVWQSADGREALVIFQGPNAYISPSWYPSKAETHKAVPTWNYVAVHAHGRLKVIDNPNWLKAHVEELTRHHESGFENPWSVSDALEDFINTLVTAIVGIEIVITRLEGKWKLSQNRSASDRHGVVTALQDSGATTMAELMKNP
jgi:transcriptional regulator